MKLEYKLPEVERLPLTITVTMTVDQWRAVMRSQYHSSQDEFRNLIASALGDLTRMSEARYEQPKIGKSLNA